MHIFLDTSVLYTDPYLNEIFKKDILDACKKKQLNIIVCEVVFKELTHNYEKNLTRHNNDIKKSNTEIGKLIPDFQQAPLLDIKGLTCKLKDFYSRLGELDNFTILPVDKDLLPVILEKSIHRSKPFTEKKTELKDALIWHTYINHIHENNLQDCYLLTANVNDFGFKLEDGAHVLHPDLKKECDRVILVRDFKEISKIFKDTNEKLILTWIDVEEITEEYVYEKLFDSNTPEVYNHVLTHLDRINIEKYFSDSHLIRMGGYVDLMELSWMYCSNIEVQINDNTAIISGILETNGTVCAYAYNSVRDPGEDQYSFIGDVDIAFSVYFNVAFDETGPRDFEITHIDDEAS